MKKVIFSFAIACVGFLMTSCCTGKSALTESSLGGDWNIVEVDGKALSTTAEQTPFIGFDTAKKRIYGHSGCNRMMGGYTLDTTGKSAISFGQVASTRMACPDMATEQSVLKALEQVQSYKVISCKKSIKEGNCKVALCNAQGKQVLVIEKQPAKALTIDALAGEWNLVSVNGEAIPAGMDKAPFLGFDIAQKHVYGVSGCNNINGALTQDPAKSNSIDFGRMASTMMACPDMATEGKINVALGTVKSFDITPNGELILCDAAGKTVVTLVKK